jgi:hypothetical protein
MPVPLILGAASLAASVVGTGLSMWGNQQSQAAAEKAANERNRVAGLNLGFEKDVANQNYQAGREQIDQFRNQGKFQLATQTARAASSGLGAGGSLNLVSQFSKNNLQSDIETMNRNNLQQYNNSRKQADLNYQGAKAGMPSQGAYMANQGSTLLTGLNGMLNNSNIMSMFPKTS